MSAERQVVQRLLRGEPVAPERAGAELGYRLEGVHVGLAVWCDDEPSASRADLTELARDLGRAGGCDEPFVLADGPHHAWAWLHADGDGDAAIARIARATDELPRGVRCACGEPGEGLDGFRRTHREASDAATRPSAARLSRYRDVEIELLIAADVDAARAFALAELGPLAADDARSELLRETLRAVLEDGASGAARRLGVHKNTVTNRMRRVEELLGHPVEHRRFELEAALRALTLVSIPNRSSPRWRERPRSGLDDEPRVRT